MFSTRRSINMIEEWIATRFIQDPVGINVELVAPE